LLSVFTVVPGVFIGSFVKPFKIFSFIVTYKTTTIKNYDSIFNAFFDFSWSKVLNTFFASVLIVLFISALLGNIENHFRSGKINLSQSYSFINNNVLAAMVYYIIFAILLFLFKILLSLVIFTFHIIFSGINNAPTNLNYIIAVLIIFGAILLFCYLISNFIIALPVTLNYGYSVRDSLSNANELLDKKVNFLVYCIIIPLLFVASLIILGNVFNFLIVSNILCMIFALMYYPTLAYVAYFDLALINRYDNKNKYYY
jgi:hypothetical protein